MQRAPYIRASSGSIASTIKPLDAEDAITRAWRMNSGEAANIMYQNDLQNALEELDILLDDRQIANIFSSYVAKNVDNKAYITEKEFREIVQNLSYATQNTFEGGRRKTKRRVSKKRQSRRRVTKRRVSRKKRSTRKR
jgi:isopropylmalate/homocitrate/citramalate synthase